MISAAADGGDIAAAAPYSAPRTRRGAGRSNSGRGTILFLKYSSILITSGTRTLAAWPEPVAGPGGVAGWAVLSQLPRLIACDLHRAYEPRSGRRGVRPQRPAGLAAGGWRSTGGGRAVPPD